MSVLDRKLARDLLRLRGQLTAILLVVACGIASYVTLRSTYRSLLVSQATYYADYRFADVFASLKRAPSSVADEIARLPGAAAVETRVVVEVTLDVPGLDEPATGRLVSIPERRRAMLNDLYLRAGRWVEPGQSDEVIASEAFAAANSLGVGDGIGAVINGRWKRLRIVGIALSPEYVYEVRGGAAIFPDNRRFGVLWMGREALAPAFDLEGAFNDLAISLAPGASESAVIERIDRRIERYGGLGAYGRDEQISHRFLSDEIAQNRVSGTIIPAIFLGVAAFLLHLVLSRLVGAEHAQIAVLKAFGYGNTIIGAHYLKLALVPVLGGALLGVFAGLYLGNALTGVYTRFYRFPLLRYDAGWDLVAAAAAISLGAAALGALTAVRSAVRLPPAEAMRPESPAKFRAGWIERLGIARFIGVTPRMILRQVGRHPVKAVLSTLGLSMAVALLLVGRYFFDAVDHLIAVQFGEIQREDVVVAFNEPLGTGVRLDLQRLPGVLRVELFRSVPVRLRHEHRSRRTSILGMPPGGELRRLMDRDGRQIEMPQDGLLLTSALADLLGIGEGDSISVEVLEGRRPNRNVIVVGLVDELIGISGYMNLAALGRLLGEGETASGAFLGIDQRQSAVLNSELKRLPAVGGASMREAILRGFDETIAQSLAITTITLVIFACVIAFGVVYNGARIALAERGRDLASLRVLGFTQKEIAAMLLGEQALLTLAAIPLGFAVGYGVCSLIPMAVASELFRLPLVISRESYLFAFAIVAAASALSGLVVVRRLRHLDLIEVLKTRE
jgi:putative ABC transport system permease protein